MTNGTPGAPVRRAVLSLYGSPTDKLVIECGCKLARADSSELVAVYRQNRHPALLLGIRGIGRSTLIGEAGARFDRWSGEHRGAEASLEAD